MKSLGCFLWPADPGVGSVVPPSNRVARTGHQAGVALITVLLIVFLPALPPPVWLPCSNWRSVVAPCSSTSSRPGCTRSASNSGRWSFWRATVRENKIDHPNETWAKLPLVLPVEGGELSGRISDLQGCFNLNNLWQPAPGGQSPDPDANDRERPPMGRGAGDGIANGDGGPYLRNRRPPTQVTRRTQVARQTQAIAIQTRADRPTAGASAATSAGRPRIETGTGSGDRRLDRSRPGPVISKWGRGQRLHGIESSVPGREPALSPASRNCGWSRAWTGKLTINWPFNVCALPPGTTLNVTPRWHRCWRC